MIWHFNLLAITRSRIINQLVICVLSYPRSQHFLCLQAKHVAAPQPPVGHITLPPPPPHSVSSATNAKHGGAYINGNLWLPDAPARHAYQQW